MSQYFSKKINVTRLRVNPNNVRYEQSAKDQNDAIRKIIEDQGRKFVNLAKHIASYGLGPGRSVYVHPITGSKDYVVLDGNRRMSALKVLLSRDLQQEFKDLLPKNFGKISDQFLLLNKIDLVECSVFPIENDANEWIAVNHGFGDEGITTQDWGSDVKGKVMAGYKKAKRQKDGQVLDFLRETEFVDESFKNRIKGQRTNNTALRRFLSSDVVDRIGLNFNNGNLAFTTSQKEVVKLLIKVVSDFLDKRANTKTVWDAKARAKYLAQLEGGGYMPDLTMPVDYDNENESTGLGNEENSELMQEEPESSPVNRDEEDVSTKSSIDQETVSSSDELKINDEEPSEESENYSRPRPIKKGQEYVFSKTLKIANKDSRITDIYDELTRIKVTENPNAVSFLLRAFVEMLVKEYDKKNKIPSTGKEATLREAVVRAVEHYKSVHGKAHNNDFRGILEACDLKNLSSIFAIESFQQLVHRERLKPIVSEVIIRWQNIEPAIEHLLANT